MSSNTKTFTADAVLFDMDGTLTDSISAVEAAWGKVADDIGQDREYVIAATHGKRAVDNLAQFKPHIKSHEMDAAVQDFEESILFFADAYNSHGPGSLVNTPIDTPMTYTPISGSQTPDLSLTPSSSAPSSRANSFAGGRRPSFGTRLNNMLSMSAMPQREERVTIADDSIEEEEEQDLRSEEELLKEKQRTLKAWQVEACAVDRAVQILPGVKKMMDSIPKGRYAVATSGAKTYAYGCMTRVGITPPPVTITADDKRLKNGKPFPDPFLLAAKELGYDAKRCVVFEDSPSGIKAGVASGATVIAVCTSHERSRIENAGAHYIVDNMEHVKCEVEDGKLKFSVTL
ncbi:HAD-like protein [Coniophora puteana RWD-64-598 SS2]|uniref:HAD-like protein n=1 Tax=Coniophora puteana (strain RWD-64-598) TaxID=741705 RepID=R7SEJ5_CONPW|nr:HAD-like protein [Coniophora puteana RWD-64-598 SS2]EIW74598.1 HAD-like protein [Coniophora puteana RWD-64-598 SS2]